MLYQFILDNPSLHVSAKTKAINESSEDLFFNFGVKFPYDLHVLYSVQNGISLPGVDLFTHQKIYDRTMEDRNINKPGDDKKIFIGLGTSFQIYYNYHTEAFELKNTHNAEVDSYETFNELFDVLYVQHGWENIKEDMNYEELAINEFNKINPTIFVGLEDPQEEDLYKLPELEI